MMVSYEQVEHHEARRGHRPSGPARSIRDTVRVTDVAKNTITALLVEIGEACLLYRSNTLRDLDSTRSECDETGSFYQAKPNVPA